MSNVTLLNSYIDPLQDINNEENTVQFYYEIVDNNKVIGVKEGTDAWIEGISQYQLDYAIMAFGEIIRREISKDPNVIFNNYFQKFMQLVSEFKRIVLEFRQSPTGEATPPIHSDSFLPKKFYCGNLDMYHFDDTISNELRNIISDGIVNPKIYVKQNEWKTLIPRPSQKFINAYTIYNNLCQTEINDLYTDVILKVQEAWNSYILSLDQTDIPQTVNKIHIEFQKNMAEINNQIINGDYRVRYDTIESLLNKSVGLMDDLIASTNTEFNIVEKAANIDSYYEKINFENEDIDPSLVIPTDKYDLVSEDQIRNEINNSNKKNAKRTTSNIFANTYNIPTSLQNIIDVSSLTSNLLDSLDKSSNITTPSHELLELTMTKIYRNREGKVVAEYLNDEQIKNLKDQQLIDQNAYLYRIDEMPDIIESGIDIARNRMEAYNKSYPNIIFTQSGGTKYDIKDRSIQRISMVQSGGRKIDIDDILNSSTQSTNDIKNIQNQIDTINKLYEKQNTEYFKNDEFLNTKNLQQRNDFLVEMMNIIIVYNFLLGSKTNEHQVFFEKLETKINFFKDNLTEMWNNMKSRIDTQINNNNNAIDTLLANGDLTINEIKNLLTSVGLAPSAAYIGSDEIINRSNILKIISGLADRYGISNIALISNELYKLYNMKPIKKTNNITINDLYSQMNSLYSSLVTLSNNLSSQYWSVASDATDLNTLEQFIGDILETNLDTTNVFIKELTSVLQNFGIKTTTIQNIRQEMRNSKMRITNFDIYMKELLNKLKSRENILESRHNILVKNKANGGIALVNHNMEQISDFYKNYVSDYSAKISGATNNIIRYFSYTKDLDYIDKRKRSLNKNVTEFDILATSIFENYPFNNNLPSKINKMYIKPSAFNNTWQNNFFDKLVAKIMIYMDNFVGIMSKSYSLVPLYPDFDIKLAKSNLVSDILNIFSASRPSDIKQMLYYYLDRNTDSDKWFFNSLLDTNIHESYLAIDNLANKFKKYILYMQIYRDKMDNTQMYSSVNDLYQIEDTFNEIHNKYIESRNDDDLQKLINSILNAKNLNPDIEKLKTNLKNFIVNDAISTGFQIDNKENMIQYQKQIIKHFNVLTYSIFSLFNKKIQTSYQIINTLTLINNAYNPNYNQIRQAYQDVNKLSIQSTQLELSNNHDELEKTSNILLPEKKALHILNPNRLYMIDASFIDRANFIPPNLHDLINTCNPSKDRPFRLQYVNKRRFNVIRIEYQKFDRIITPLIKLMKTLVESGVNITNTGNKIIFDTDLTYIDEKLYTNSFTFENEGIIFVNNNGDIVPLYNKIYNTKTTNIVGDLRKTGEYLDTYILQYNNNDMKILNNAVTYIINTDPVARIYNIRTFWREIKLEIDRNEIITLFHIDQIIKLLNTTRHLINFMDKLSDIVPKIEIIDVEKPETWYLASNSFDPIYKKRTNKKHNLIEVLRTLEYIDNEIRSDSNNYYLSDVLLRDRNNVKNRDVIMNARIDVESKDPMNKDFNKTIDKIWIFARKVVNVWYTIFGHMLSYIILNNEVSNLIKFAQLININVDEILSLNSYKNAVIELKKYESDTVRELNTSEKILSKNRQQYPININSDVNTTDKYVITDSAKKIVEYDEFYSNVGNKSESIYVILALIKNNKINEIKKSLSNISTVTNELVNIVELVDPFLNPINIRDKTSSIQIDQFTLDELNLIINNFSKSILSEFKTIFYGTNQNPTYILVKNKISLFIENILTKYLTDYEPDLNNNPLIIPNRMINTSSLDPLNYLVLHIEEIDNKVQWIRPAQTRSHYQFIYNKFIYEQTQESVRDLFSLLITDIYGIIFSAIINEIYDLMAKINDYLSTIMVTELYSIRSAFVRYFNMKRIKYIYPASKKPFNIIKEPGNNNNSDNIKFILFTGQRYSSKKTDIMEIYDTFKNVTTYVKSNLSDIYQNEIDMHQQIINMDIELINNLRKNKKDIRNKSIKLHNVIQIISLVMFNEHYKSFAFINNTKLLDHVSRVVNNYETIWTMIGQKIRDIANKNNYHTLTIGQINNYIAFKSTINKLIKNKSIINNFYKRLSFGIIEYYYDILNSIIYCLENKSYETMSEVEQYLYQFHYIQIKRCHILFKWLRHEYLPSKQDQDNLIRSNKNFKSILQHKIETLKTRADANLIFVEFQGLRKYLDDYSATVMDKVQLHLRINDFAIEEKNNELVTNSRGRDYKFLYDDKPESPEYHIKWESGNLIFTNPNDDNILRVNFDLLDRIRQYDNINTNIITPYKILYSDVYDKMEPTFVGIDFQRIYNTKIFPDSDVISNYMSIAPNIISGKGTVIMTYGYSGVGKSVSLFGRDGNPSKGIVPSNGILQATLGYFSNVEIRFRVFEIYGMGTQYNYYWNPQNDNTHNYECFPNLTQCVIHHVIDNRNPRTLKSVDRIVFNNKHDIFAYIMDLKNPRAGTKFSVNSRDKFNLSGTNSRNNISKYFDDINGELHMRDSTYIEIVHPDQYYNFNTLVGNIDNLRKKGLEIKKLLEHLAKQIKPTINNPESSRSILVYDFEINLDRTSDNPVFVPFIIYDLPGKEDVYRTYVDSVGYDNEKSFRDFPKDIAKERKSTYVTNPLLIPIFDENANIIRDILIKLSNDELSPEPYTATGPPTKFNEEFEKNIVEDIIKYTITTFAYPDANNNDYTDPGASYTVGSLYQNPDSIKTFYQLFVEDNIKPELYDLDMAQESLVIKLGIIGINGPFEDGIIDKNLIAMELRVLICVIIIAYLIKHQLFDLLVEIINVVVNGSNGSNDNSNGGWSRSKIYSFYEAYYINENVVGLLQYLINNILKKNSTIEEQDTINENINEIVNKNYKTANRYRAILNLFKTHPDEPVNNDYGFTVNTDLLTVKSADGKINVLKEMEIDDFKNKNQVSDDGIFGTRDSIRENMYNKMANVISFENRGKYDNNKIFRSGNASFTCTVEDIPNGQNVINPRKAIVSGDPEYLVETNRPLLQDFIEPYEQKISFYYVFYVVSNNQMKLKAEEQIKLLNNSMPFIKEMDPTSQKSKCSS